MVTEAIWALLLAGLPIGLFTLAIVWWGLRNGYFPGTNDARALERELKAMKKEQVKPAEDKRSLLHKKWAKFGGGFYGIVAFFTYLVVEVTEITTMIINFGGFLDFLKKLDMGVIVSVFVEAITNFITAMVWPVYWMDRIDTSQIGFWFAAAYSGYWLGLHLARTFHQGGPQNDKSDV